jgi:hypothetical protein
MPGFNVAAVKKAAGGCGRRAEGAMDINGKEVLCLVQVFAGVLLQAVRL